MDAQLKFQLQEAIPILDRTPAVISGLLDDLPEDWTRVNEGADTWSPREVVAPGTADEPKRDSVPAGRRSRLHLTVHSSQSQHTESCTGSGTG